MGVISSQPSRWMFVLALCAALGFANPGTETKLTASDAAAGDFFGFPVVVSGDTAVVGAENDDDGGYKSGSAYVLVLTVAASPYVLTLLKEGTTTQTKGRQVRW